MTRMAMRKRSFRRRRRRSWVDPFTVGVACIAGIGARNGKARAVVWRTPNSAQPADEPNMTRKYLRQLGMAVLLVLPRSVAIAQNGRFDLEKTKKVLTAVIDKTLADNGVPSMSIALVRGDSIVWKAAFGYTNMYTRSPATTATLYSTGSSFKSVTATAIMQLAEQGKLKLD